MWGILIRCRLWRRDIAGAGEGGRIEIHCVSIFLIFYNFFVGEGG